MSLQMPDLDDRTFDDLLAEALDQVRNDLHTSWNDFSPGDPGVILLEAFSYLTEQMLYRLNRVPEKAYIAFLRMMGVGLKPPTAAQVTLSFWQTGEGFETIRVPQGTRVASKLQGAEATIFITAEDLDVSYEACNEETAGKVLAYHAAWAEEDLPAPSNGLPGQVFAVKSPPILANANRMELRLGVELTQQSEWAKDDWVTADGRHFQVWQEVPNFAGLTSDAPAYRVDRQAGLIQFAPAAYLYPSTPAGSPNGHNGNNNGGRQALAAVPPKGRAIHVRYPIGGGAGGNIPDHLLETIQEPAGEPNRLAARLKVTNPEPARGGMNTETLANALIRGPQEIFTQDRLITARDFERTVLRLWPVIARARALALQDLWEHAQPGNVSVTLVPALRGPEFTSADKFTREALEYQQTLLTRDNALLEVRQKLEEESPLGIRAQLDWARYKRVSISAEVSVPRGTQTAQVQQRLQDMLYRTVSPLPPPLIGADSGGAPASALTGWGFGAELHLAEVSRWIFTSEPNVRLLRTLELKIDSAPDVDVRALAADHFQPDTWFAASGMRLFRSTNNGNGWEQLLDFSPGKTNLALHFEGQSDPGSRGQLLKAVCPSPYRAGLVAVAALDEPSEPPRGPIYLSTDCGESWYRLCDIDAEVEDLDWLQRGGRHILLLATSQGLKELHINFDARGAPSLDISLAIPVIDENSTGSVMRDPSLLVPVVADNSSIAVNAVKVIRGRGGMARVAVAMHGRRGVYLSNGIDMTRASGETNFARLDADLPGRPSQSNPSVQLDRIPADIRCLGVQWCEQENRFLLWAGAMAVGHSDTGDGCCRWSFDEQLRSLDRGRWLNAGWKAGSCLGLAFQGNTILAATARGAIQVAYIKPPTRETGEEISDWQSYNDPDQILPLRWVRFEGLDESPQEPPGPQKTQESSGEDHIPFTAIATNDQRPTAHTPLAMVGCAQGIFRSQDGGVTYAKVSRDTFRQWADSVTIPPNWMLVSGTHIIRVVEEGTDTQASSGQNGGEASHAAG